jgi:hypothetical protein
LSIPVLSHPKGALICPEEPPRTWPARLSRRAATAVTGNEYTYNDIQTATTSCQYIRIKRKE